MKEAKVFLVEEHESTRLLEKRVITLGGHSVELETGSISEALIYINAKLTKGRKIDVAVLSGPKGKGIALVLRKEVPGIKIVSCSTTLKNWGDINLDKNDILKIGEAIDKL